MATSEAIDGEKTTGASAGKGLGVALWVAQCLLVLGFLAAGLMKSTQPIEQLKATMPWVNGSMGQLVRFIGAVEILGAAGLILPSVTRIKPWLTPLAALGLLTVMLLAAATHLARGESPMLGINAVLGGLAAFIAWGRYFRAPIAPRS
jgi:hypothetical protein